jgi:uncharacterized protein
MLSIYAAVVTKHAKWVLLVLLLLSLSATWVVKDLRLDNNFATLFATDSQAMTLRAQFRETFGADDNQLVAVLERPSNPEKLQTFLLMIDTLSETIALQPAIDRVNSVSHTSVIWDFDDQLFIEPVFARESGFEGDFNSQVSTVSRSSLGGARLLSADGHYFLVVGEMRPDLDSYEKILQPAQQFKEAVNAAIDESGLTVNSWFAGFAFTRIAAIGQMQGDLITLFPVTSVFLALFMLFIFRSLMFVLLPMISIGVSIVLTGAMIKLCGDDINQMTIIFPILLMVVTVANATHLLHRFREEFERCDTINQAVYNSVLTVSKACFLASLTTFIGFASMLSAEMEILHSFGLYLAAGVMISFAVVCLLIPAGLAVFAKPERMPPNRQSSFAFNNPGLVTPLVNPPVAAAVTCLGLLLLGLSLYQAQSAVYDYSLSGMLDESTATAQANRLVDEKLSGVLPIEISFLSTEGDKFSDPAMLKRLDRVGLWLQDNYSVSAPISLASVIKELNRSFSGDYSIPNSPNYISQLLLVAESAADAPLSQLVTEDYSHARIRSSSADLGARFTADLQLKLEHFAADVFAGTGVKVSLTGEAPAGYDGMNHLASELVISVLLAVVFIVLTIGLVFRSVTIAVASILPNLLPITIGLALYTLSGKYLNPLPGVAFCIAIGISVDDTVHLFARFKEELANGHSQRRAIIIAVDKVKSALVHSSIILIAGFLVFLLSGFDWNRQLGILGALLVFLALICDFLFTPALIALFPDSKKSTTESRHKEPELHKIA